MYIKLRLQRANSYLSHSKRIKKKEKKKKKKITKCSIEIRENRDHVLGLMSVRSKVRQLHYVPAPQTGINTALLSLCGLPRTPIQLESHSLVLKRTNCSLFSVITFSFQYIKSCTIKYHTTYFTY